MAKRNWAVQRKILARAEQMTAELTQFAKEDLLLQMGQHLRVTIEIINDVTVDFKIRSLDDKIYDVILTPAHWKEALALPWDSIKTRGASLALGGEEIRRALLKIQAGGQCLDLSDNDLTKCNNFLRRQGARFKMVLPKGGRGRHELRAAR